MSGNAFQPPLVHHLSNALNHGRLVGLVRQLGDDDGFPVGAAPLLNGFDCWRPPRMVTEPRPDSVGIQDAAATQNLPPGGESQGRG